MSSAVGKITRWIRGQDPTMSKCPPSEILNFPAQQVSKPLPQWNLASSYFLYHLGFFLGMRNILVGGLEHLEFYHIYFNIFQRGWNHQPVSIDGRIEGEF